MVASEEQPYKYNGKELDTMDGLNWYDYSARHYDPAIARFSSIDPMAEKYYSISPYVYVNNNPLKYIDPTGMFNEDPPGLKQIRFAIFNPSTAMRIGKYKPNSDNISTHAGNFGINLTKAMERPIVGEGNYNNAIRHVTWQALITKEFGDQKTMQAGNAHEENVRWTDFEKRSFNKLKPADKLVDLLNNMIGRKIGKENSESTNTEIVGKIINEFTNEGLWTVTEHKNGNYTIQRTKLTDEEHINAMKRLDELDNDGLTKKN